MPPVETMERTDGATIEVFASLSARADEFESYAHPHAARIAAIGAGRGSFPFADDRMTRQVNAFVLAQ